MSGPDPGASRSHRSTNPRPIGSLSGRGSPAPSASWLSVPASGTLCPGTRAGPRAWLAAPRRPLRAAACPTNLSPTDRLRLSLLQPTAPCSEAAVVSTSFLRPGGCLGVCFSPPGPFTRGAQLAATRLPRSVPLVPMVRRCHFSISALLYRLPPHRPCPASSSLWMKPDTWLAGPAASALGDWGRSPPSEQKPPGL